MQRDSRATDVRIRPRDVAERNGMRSAPLPRNSQPTIDDFDRLKNRLINCEGELAVKAKEAVQLKGEKKKLEEQVRELTRNVEKSKDQLAKANAKAGHTQKEAALTSEVRQLKMENERLAGEIKGCSNMIRSKDKELERLATLVEAAEEVRLRNKELENQFSHMQQQLDSASQEIRTLQQVNRQREADISALNDEIDDLRSDLMHTTDSLSISNATLKALENKNSDMATEVAVMRDELTRTNVVAHRVAKLEHKAGLKHLEGTVSLMQHQEEVKFLQGDVARLRDKLAQVERELAVSRELQERYRQQAESTPTNTRSSSRPPISPSAASSVDTTASPPLDFMRPPSVNGLVADYRPLSQRLGASLSVSTSQPSPIMRRSPSATNAATLNSPSTTRKPPTPGSSSKGDSVGDVFQERDRGVGRPLPATRWSMAS